MKWEDVRDKYPNNWILLEAIEAHSVQEKRVVDKISVPHISISEDNSNKKVMNIMKRYLEVFV